jgi:hypothetical protein
MSPSEGHGGGSLLEHFHVSDSEHWVVIKWKKHEHVDEPVRVAVLRSEQGFADKAEEALDENSGQLCIYEGADDECQDQDVVPDVTFYYTCFARTESTVWERQHHDKVKIPHGRPWEHREVMPGSARVKETDRLRLGLYGTREAKGV